MSMRRLVLLYCLVQLLSPASLTAADGNEIDFLLSKGQGLQNKAFQAGPDERKRHLRGAIREYEKIFYLAPDNDIAYMLAGSCYEHLGEFQTAAETYALGAERVVARNKKLVLLSNVARVYANMRNLRGVAGVITQMEYLDPRAIQIAAASRDLAMDGADEQTRARYARKCLGICDYLLQNSRHAEIREQATNLKQGLELHQGSGETSGEPTAQSSDRSDPWKDLFADARRGDYVKVVIRHQSMLAAEERLDPLSKSYVNPVPSYLPYLNALLESYCRTGRWDVFFGVARRAILRRTEIQDEGFHHHAVSAVLPAFNTHLASYLTGSRPLDFRRPSRAALLPRLWLYEIKGSQLLAVSENDKNETFPDADTVALGWRGRDANPYRIFMRFAVPPALAGVAIQKAAVSLLREHRHIQAGSNEDNLPVLCESDPARERQRTPCRQSEHIPPDADSLMRRDVGESFGGYAVGQLYLFDITAAIKSGLKRKKTAYAAVILLRDETARAFRSFWSARSSHSPKVSIIVRSDSKPEADDIMEYEEDWIDLYARGLSYVQNGKIGAAQVLWEEAAKRSGDEAAAWYIRTHLAIIRGANR